MTDFRPSEPGPSGPPGEDAPAGGSGGKHYLAWAGLLLITGVFLFAGYAGIRKQQPQSLTTALSRGQRPLAPEFRLARFEGGELALSSLRGRYVVMNFWASWCVPCKEETPLVERVWREYRARDVVVLGVNVQDLEASARKFMTTFGVTYPNVRDRDGAVNRAYGITGIPETFFITREGRVVRKFPGAAVEWRLWNEAVEQLLLER